MSGRTQIYGFSFGRTRGVLNLLCKFTLKGTRACTETVACVTRMELSR